MKSYDEALKVWAANRFGIALDKIASVELKEIPEGEGTHYGEVTFEPGEPAHLEANIWPKDWSGCSWDTTEKLNGPLAAVIYEVVHAGLGDQ